MSRSAPVCWISTVSNALNGRPERMRKETFSRVEAVIAELGFQPNRAARQLKTGRTPLIGILIPSIANPSYGSLAHEIEIVAQQRHGYRVLLGSTYRNQEKESGFFDDLLSHGVRGVIVISSLADQNHVYAAIRRGLVAVSYDRRAPRTVVADRLCLDGQRQRRETGGRTSFGAWPQTPRIRDRVGADAVADRKDRRVSRRRPPGWSGANGDGAGAQGGVRIRRCGNGGTGSGARGRHRDKQSSSHRDHRHQRHARDRLDCRTARSRYPGAARHVCGRDG